MKINLARQDTSKYKRAEKIKKLNNVVIVVSVGLFFIAVLSLTGQLAYYKFRGDSLNEDLRQLQATYTSRAGEVVKYLKTKQTVGSVSLIEGRRFLYKEYLFELYSLLPSEAKLGSVDFNKIGVITASVRLPSIQSYDLLVKNIETVRTKADSNFSQISQDNFLRNKDGVYQVNLEVKIK